jgi:hypothetical protein
LSKKDLLLRVLVIFLGPEPPGFDDSDSDSDDTDNVVSPGNSIVVQPYSATLSSIVPDDSASENGSTGIYITSHSREDENSIKLRVIGAGSCFDASDNDAAKGMEETERKSPNNEEKKQK